MTLQDRAAAYANRFAKFPASRLRVVQEQGRDVLYGVWVLGNDYRNRSRLYGAYPPTYVERVCALFPDVGVNVLHVFSGSLPPSAFYQRLDLVDRCGVPDPNFHQGSVYNALQFYPAIQRSRACGFQLILADPPYSAEDATRYDTPMVNRRRAMASLATVCRRGGFLVWLDTVWPMHSKTQWVTIGRILVQRSTNHRARVWSLFERVA